MKTKIFYHANCADGFGAAYASYIGAKGLGIEDVEYIPVSYGTIKTIDDVDLLGEIAGCAVVILDFSFPLDVMNHIFAHAKKTVWLDHHKTAFEMWIPDIKLTNTTRYEFEDDSKRIVLDNAKSGALLASEEFLKEPSSISKMLDDYDRWQFKIKDSEAFNKYLWSIAPWTFEQWEQLDDDLQYEEFYNKVIEIGNSLLAEHERQVQTAIKRPRKISLGGHNGWAVNAPPNLSSNAGHHLAKINDTFGMTYHIGNDLMVRCSLRSSNDFDVSVIAKHFGGGGHKNAAGFELTMSKFLEVMNGQPGAKNG